MDAKTVFAPALLRDFRRIYGRAAGDGREARLFGVKTREKAEAALAKYALDASEQGFYFELPLMGEPRMDLLLQYDCDAIRLPISFCDSSPGRAHPCAPEGHIFSSFFESCAKDPALARYLVGYSFDLSEDRDLPGIYLLPPSHSPNVGHVPAMLERLGAAERLPRVTEAFAAAPRAGSRTTSAICPRVRARLPVWDLSLTENCGGRTARTRRS